ncbi:unnamed protein product, partial [Rotaria socialis]
MDRNVHNDLARTSIMLDLATIKEDIGEIDDNNDDDESTKREINKITDENDLSLRLQNRTDVENDLKDDESLETITTIVHHSNEVEQKQYTKEEEATSAIMLNFKDEPN